MLTRLPASPAYAGLLDPTTVQARLKLPDSDLPILTDVVLEASDLAVKALGFEPAYGSWSETFREIRIDSLYLGARPLTPGGTVVVTERSGDAADSGSYLVDLELHRIVRTGDRPWYLGEGADPWRVLPQVDLTGNAAEAWDWTITYSAGWWLETMSGAAPAGVPVLPAAIARDVIRLSGWLWTQETAPLGVKRMKKDGAEVEYFEPGQGGLDPATGAPLSCLSGIALYKR